MNLVHLDAERIGEELKRPALVVVGVQHDSDVIVFPDRIPITKVSPYSPGVRILGIERKSLYRKAERLGIALDIEEDES